MIRLILLFLLLFFAAAAPLSAQNEHLKNDYLWLIGYNYYGPEVKYDGIMLDFHAHRMALRTESRWIQFDHANAGLCNDKGELAVYTNGCRMFNGKHELLLNGDSLPNQWIYDGYCAVYQLHVLRQCNLLLPQPGNDSMVYHLALDLRLDANSQLFAISDTFYQSVINLKAAGGRGALVIKNQPVLSDTFFYANHLTACRHANGRDWWVVVPGGLNNRYHFFLLDPTGLHFDHTQNFGTPAGLYGVSTGQAVFSPQGDWYIASENRLGVRVYHFDRCAGLFYGEPLEMPIMEEPNDSGWNTPGVAVSANNRYLYVAFYLNCYQFDLEQPDILATKQHIAQWDTFFTNDRWSTTFYYLKLAPDGKIYGSIPGPNTYLHRINQPDLPGVACDFEQQAILLPNWNYAMLPNMPWFRTGVLKGSICDSLNLVDTEVPESPLLEVVVAPNPAADKLFIHLENAMPESTHSVRFYDATGRFLQARQLEKGQTDLEFRVAYWPQGLYFWEVVSGIGSRSVGRFVVR